MIIPRLIHYLEVGPSLLGRMRATESLAENRQQQKISVYADDNINIL